MGCETNAYNNQQKAVKALLRVLKKRVLEESTLRESLIYRGRVLLCFLVIVSLFVGEERYKRTLPTGVCAEQVLMGL
jgi:hypothetical protein